MASDVLRRSSSRTVRTSEKRASLRRSISQTLSEEKFALEEENQAKQMNMEELLLEEQRKLDELEENLLRSKHVTNQMFTVIDAFHARLNDLESDILPVFSSTQQARGLYHKMDDVIQEITRITHILDSSKRVEKTIRGGPHGDFQLYGACLKEIGEAENYLRNEGASFLSAPAAMMQLQRLKAIGQEKCEESLINLIGKSSTPKLASDVLAKIDEKESVEMVDIPKGRIPLSKERLREIAALSEALQLCSPSKLSTKWVKEYQNRRKAFLLHTLQSHQTMNALQEHVVERKIKADKQHPYVQLLLVFLPLVQGELLLAQEVLTSSWEEIAAMVCGPAVDYIVECGDSLCKLYQSVSLFLRYPLMDILLFMRRLSSVLNPLFRPKPLSKMMVDIENLRMRIQGKIQSAFTQVADAIHSDHDPIRETGTVDQLTSNVLNFLVNLENQQSLVDSMLPPSTTQSGTIDQEPFAFYLTKVLGDLMSAIVKKANDEKSVPLRCIYVMNNIQYIITKLNKSSLGAIVPESIFVDAKKQIAHFSNTYKTSWNKCISLLMIKQRSKIKKSQIQNFNTEFEDMFHQQQQLIISDKDLKEEVINEIRAVIAPCYAAFLDQAKQTFGDDPSLIRYPQKVMERMFEKMFTGQGEESRSTGKKKLLSKFKV